MTSTTKYYSIRVKQLRRKTKIDMNVYSPVVSTRSIPNTFKILKEHLPGVLETRCFNDDNLPFSEEVKKTEIGHLFEHIILQYMLEMKMALGQNKFVLNGWTSWNWKKEKRGTFHIDIDTGIQDSLVFKEALNKSEKLMQQILSSVN